MGDNNQYRVQVRPSVSDCSLNEALLSIERTKKGHIKLKAKGWLPIVAVFVVTLVIVFSL